LVRTRTVISRYRKRKSAHRRMENPGAGEQVKGTSAEGNIGAFGASWRKNNLKLGGGYIRVLTDVRYPDRQSGTPHSR